MAATLPPGSINPYSRHSVMADQWSQTGPFPVQKETAYSVAEAAPWGRQRERSLGAGTSHQCPSSCRARESKPQRTDRSRHPPPHAAIFGSSNPRRAQLRQRPSDILREAPECAFQLAEHTPTCWEQTYLYNGL